MEYRSITIEELDVIKPMWEALNRLHEEDSSYFKERYAQTTFAMRCKKFYDFDEMNIHIVVAYDKDEAVGYVISTISKDYTGELESLYLNDFYRGKGYGKILVEKSMEWMKLKSSKRIVLAVAEGHESVLDFYKKLGFFPRLTYLEYKPD